MKLSYKDFKELGEQLKKMPDDDFRLTTRPFTPEAIRALRSCPEFLRAMRYGKAEVEVDGQM